MLLTLRNHHKVLKKIFSRVVNVNLKIFKMSRYFTEENDGGMSAEVFTISKDDTNHASKIRSSVMREKGKEFKRSKNELFYAKKKNKAKCSNRLKVLKLRQVVGIWRKSLYKNLNVQCFKKLIESSQCLCPFKISNTYLDFKCLYLKCTSVRKAIHFPPKRKKDWLVKNAFKWIVWVQKLFKKVHAIFQFSMGKSAIS